MKREASEVAERPDASSVASPCGVTQLSHDDTVLRVGLGYIKKHPALRTKPIVIRRTVRADSLLTSDLLFNLKVKVGLSNFTNLYCMTLNGQ